jgi:diguanylate cyclase (GGDEF)-like protein
MSPVAPLTPQLASHFLAHLDLVHRFVDRCKDAGVVEARHMTPTASGPLLGAFEALCHEVAAGRRAATVPFPDVEARGRFALFNHAAAHWVAGLAAAQGVPPPTVPHDPVVLASRSWFDLPLATSVPPLVDALPAGIVQLDAAGWVVWANRAARSRFGLMPGTCLFDHLVGEAAVPVAEAAISRDGGGLWLARPPRLIVRGTPVHVDLVAALADPGVCGWAGMILEATEDDEQIERLRTAASTDDLTGLANRRTFLDRLREELGRPADLAIPFALALIDLDGFKAVNDTFGHRAGDEVLRTVAGRLVDSTGPADLCARLAGDEFAVLIDDARSRPPHRVVETIRTALARPISSTDGVVGTVDASVGVVVVDPQAAGDVGEVMHLADLAMYADKRRSGGGQAGVGWTDGDERRPRIVTA